MSRPSTGASTLLGFIHPFLVLARRWVGGGHGQISNREFLSGIIEAAITYATNRSGAGLGLPLPAAIKRRVGDIASELFLLPQGQSYAELADQIAESLEEFYQTIADTFFGQIEKWFRD